MSLILYGPSSYATTWAPTGTTAKINIPAIIEASTTGVSGSISVQLWYFAAPYAGATQQISAKFATYTYPATLAAGQEYKPLSVSVPVIVPNLSFANTTYYVALLVVESSGATTKVDDYQNLGSKTFTRYPGPGGDGGSADNAGGSGDSGGSAGSSNQGSETGSYGAAPAQDVTTFRTVGTSGTITGATWPCLMVLQADKSYATSLGADTLVAQGGAATITASGAALYFGGTGPTVFNATGASATLVGGGAETVNAGAANILLFGGTGGVGFFAGSGASTVVSGAGGGTLTGGSGSTLLFATGPTAYRAGAGVDTVISYAGAMTATGGANGTVFFTGSDKGGNVLTSGQGADTIIGFGPNDVFTIANNAANVVVVAGAASTINGAASSGTNSFFAFAQNDVVIGGSGTTAIQSAFGNQTLTAGSGTTLFDILDSASARTILVTNFKIGTDVVMLGGYPAAAAATALRTASLSGGSETISLTDGTTVTFKGVTTLSSNSFV